MPLCYPHELSLLVQDQFAKKVGVNQGTVARYIANTYKLPLLTQMDSLIRTQLDNDLEVWSQNYVKEFLSNRFTNPDQTQEVDEALRVAIESLDSPLQLLLKLHYSQNYSIDTLVSYLENESRDTIKEKLNLIRHELERAAMEAINQLKISYVEQFIKTHYKQVLSDQLLTAFSEIKSRKIIKMRYAQRIPEEKIARLLPKENVSQAINQGKQQLQQALLQWSYGTYGISLEPEKDQVSQGVETWLNQLYCLDLNELHSGE